MFFLNSLLILPPTTPASLTNRRGNFRGVLADSCSSSLRSVWCSNRKRAHPPPSSVSWWVGLGLPLVVLSGAPSTRRLCAALTGVVDLLGIGPPAMGGVCSAGIAGDRSPAELSFRAFSGFVVEQEFKAFSAAGKAQGKNKTAPVEETASFSENGSPPCTSRSIPKESHLTRASSEKHKKAGGKPRQSTSGKVSDRASVFGRASTSAVQVLDTLSSSMSSLSPGGGSGFATGAAVKGNRVSILAFEVANTVVKGMSLMQSLSTENLKHLKETVLRSEGVQRLVSADMGELTRIAAADKRQELGVFSREVVRFGNRCKDPQWHNLDRYFCKLESEIAPQPNLKETAKAEMQQLMTLVRHTADLYHELHALDRFEQDYRRKLEEEKRSIVSERGDTIQIIRQELKSQRKYVHNLKKKSLWNKILEDVMEKLVDIVHYLHVEIRDAFGSCDGAVPLNGSSESHQTLGSAGLSLHYANIVSQIDNIVSRSSVPPQSTRDALYQGLPPNVKSALRIRLQTCSEFQEVPITQTRSSMEKTLQWIVPVANNTTRAHHGFGWVGEWANTGNDLMRRAAEQPEALKIETLHHASMAKAEACILDLVVWLHRLISYNNGGCSPGAGGRSPSRRSGRSPTRSPSPPSKTALLTSEDREMLAEVYMRRRQWRPPGKSKSQELSSSSSKRAADAALNKDDRLSKSSNHSMFPLARRPRAAAPAVVGFDIDGIEARGPGAVRGRAAADSVKKQW